MEKGVGKVQNQMECTPYYRCHRWGAYRHEETQENRQRLLQLQGFLVSGSPGPGGCRLQIRFLWIDCGSSDSSSDAQIFNRSLLREEIKDSNFGLPPPEPLGEGGPELY